ncbi:DUF397 domain-containing protein [Streptomyces daliensis]|uniref:DUF397 domain-containing protein n=1 Tax=Streptomyces daliensis TaxID=299421 RepID=A0A8T4IZV6_9ACTN|nr:DUF397 domain-containing protein [Streptomyces daliensis]
MSPAFGRNLSAATWRKSSYSNGQGGDCLEIAEDFPDAATWRKSSHSDSQGGACLEVADTVKGLVPVRDSKDPSRTPLVFAAPAWAAFVAALQEARS